MADFEHDLQRYRRKMDEGFKNLSFSPDMEAEYVAQYFKRNIVKQRLALCISATLVLLLTPFDLEVLSGGPETFYLVTRFMALLPILIIAFAFTYNPMAQKHFQTMAFTMVLAIGLTSNMFVAYANSMGQPMPSEILILIIFIGFLLAGMRFRQSLTCAVVLFSSYFLLALFYMPMHFQIMHDLIFIFSSCLIGGATAFTLEYQTRLGFLQKGALRSAAKIDPLTHLLNRGAINQQLDLIMDLAYREQKFVTLVLLDVDYFKNYNDSYGHIKGDNCLIKVAKELSKGCRRSLDFAGRYGGEEFILAWYDTKPEEMIDLSEQIANNIRKLNIPHDKSKVSNLISLSGGMVSGIPSATINSQVLIQHADDLLYASKNQGRNKILNFTFPQETIPEKKVLVG